MQAALLLEVSQMDHDREKASEALFSLIARAEPRLSVLGNWYAQVVETIDKWYRSEGNQGVKRAKDALHMAWVAILSPSRKQPPLAFVKAKEGLPELVIPLVNRVRALKADARLMSGVLSLIRVTDLWEGSLNRATVLGAIDKIENPVLPNTASLVFKEFQGFLDAVLATPAYDRVPFVQALRKRLRFDLWDQYYFSDKAGPQRGPLMECAHLDVVTLRRCKTTKGTSLMSEIVHTIAQEIEMSNAGASGPSETNRIVGLAERDPITGEPLSLLAFSDEELLAGEPDKPAEYPGRLAFKVEKSGKIRVFAMPDYFTQVALYPLGQWLREVLKAFPGDCTFDQGARIPKIQEWQEEGRTLFSFDQSSCTDLFPMEMQRIVLENAFNREFAESVHTVLTDREWLVTFPKEATRNRKGESRSVRWSVGQPLGAYASWPLMALTHHLLVQFASWRATSDKTRWKPFDDYCICGDDIVIGSVTVANSYLRLVKRLGMKINLAKSYISGRNTGMQASSEFAKRFVWNTTPLYPLKPHMVLAAVRDWRVSVPLLWELRNPETWNLSKACIKWVIRRFLSPGKRYLEFLITVPQSLGGVGFKVSPSWRAWNKAIIQNRTFHPILHKLAGRIRSMLVRRGGKRWWAESYKNRKLSSSEQKRKIWKLKKSGKDVESIRLLALDPKSIKRFSHMREDVLRVHPLVESYHLKLSESVNTPLVKRDLDIPTKREILRDILVHGFDRYESFLSDDLDNRSLPPWHDWEVEHREQSDSWRRVIDKPLGFDVFSFLDAEVLDMVDSCLFQENVVPGDLDSLLIELQLTRLEDLLDLVKRKPH